MNNSPSEKDFWNKTTNYYRLCGARNSIANEVIQCLFTTQLFNKNKLIKNSKMCLPFLLKKKKKINKKFRKKFQSRMTLNWTRCNNHTLHSTRIKTRTKMWVKKKNNNNNNNFVLYRDCTVLRSRRPSTLWGTQRVRPGV